MHITIYDFGKIVTKYCRYLLFKQRWADSPTWV